MKQMNKKQYMKPQTEVVKLQHSMYLLVYSDVDQDPGPGGGESRRDDWDN